MPASSLLRGRVPHGFLLCSARVGTSPRVYTTVSKEDMWARTSLARRRQHTVHPTHAPIACAFPHSRYSLPVYPRGRPAKPSAGSSHNTTARTLTVRQPVFRRGDLSYNPSLIRCSVVLCCSRFLLLFFVWEVFRCACHGCLSWWSIGVTVVFRARCPAAAVRSFTSAFYTKITLD